MKNKNIIKGMLMMAAGLMLTGCSSDYLDLAPESEPSTASIASSTSAARLAVRGIGRAMQCQYQKVTTANQYNGESYVNTIYGDGWGQDVIENLAQTQFGATTYAWKTMGNPRASWVNNIPWNYPYGIIYMANGVLDGIDTAEGPDDDRWFIKAQALTFRAHGYIKLLQFYAPRWEDSDNGEKYCIVIRTSQSTENQPLSKMIDVKKRVYEDLDSALALYNRSTNKREYKWEPDLSVAQGLYARAALLFHDWSLAQQMAHDARQGYQVMDNNTLFSGFCDDNNDFMWEQAAEGDDIYYWSYGSHYAVNGAYVKQWGDIGGGNINLDLYNQMDPNDVRRGLFMTPDKLEGVTSATMNPGGLKPEDFWSTDLINPLTMDMSGGLTKKDRNKPNTKYGLVNFVVQWGFDYMDNRFKGSLDKLIDPTDQFACYFQWGPSVEGGFQVAKGVQAKLYGCQIGAQYKFWAYVPYGTSHYPYMRASEMCIAEAEAAYMAGDMATAQSCLSEINSIRIPGYAGGNSGKALLDEIRLCRRVELWGEGQSWTDFKRWNIPCERRAWVADDPTSGNFGASYAMRREPNECGGWRFTVPAIESDYNPLIDRTLLPSTSEYD